MNIKTIIESKFGYTVTNCIRLSDSSLFTTYSCSISNQHLNIDQIFVKGYTSVNWDEPVRLHREISTLNWLKQKNFDPVPTIYNSRITEDYGVFITDFVTGRAIQKTAFNTNTFIESLANRLSTIHHLSGDPPDVGHFGLTGNGLIQDALRAIEGTKYVQKYRQMIHECTTIIQQTEPICGITHGDIHPSNMLYDSDWRIKNIIDWEYGGLSDKQLDLAKAEIRFLLIYKELFEEFGREFDSILQLFRNSYGYEESQIDATRITAFKLLFLIREVGLKEQFGSGWEDNILDTGNSRQICENRIYEIVTSNSTYTDL